MWKCNLRPVKLIVLCNPKKSQSNPTPTWYQFMLALQFSWRMKCFRKLILTGITNQLNFFIAFLM